MTTVHVQLDDATYERICQKAAAVGLTPEELLAQRARQEAASATGTATAQKPADSIIGMWADEAVAVDQMTQFAKAWRRERNQAQIARANQGARHREEKGER